MDHTTAFTNFASKVSLGLSQERDTLRINAAKNRREADRVLESATELLESAARQERIAASLEEMELHTLDIFIKEQWGDILKMIPRPIESIEVTQDNFLSVNTTQLTAAGVAVGPFNIKIHLKTGKINIVGINSAKIFRGVCHPHVNGSGKPCWGNLVGSVTDLTAKRDYYGLIAAALRLLCQYKRGDAYADLSNWGPPILESEDEGACPLREEENLNQQQLYTCANCQLECHRTKRSRLTACLAARNVEMCFNCKQNQCKGYKERFRVCLAARAATNISHCTMICERIEVCPYKDSLLEACQQRNITPQTACLAKETCRFSKICHSE